MSQQLPATIPANLFDSSADAIAETARELSALGWTPATSSNFSMRMGADHAAITIPAATRADSAATTSC